MSNRNGGCLKTEEHCKIGMRSITFFSCASSIFLKFTMSSSLIPSPPFLCKISSPSIHLFSNAFTTVHFCWRSSACFAYPGPRLRLANGRGDYDFQNDTHSSSLPQSRSDGKALRKIITGLRPHEVILVGATRSAIDAMVEHCRSDLQLRDEIIHTPSGLDVVNCTKEGDIYQVNQLHPIPYRCCCGARYTKKSS